MDRWRPADSHADPYDPATKWISGHYAYTGSLPNRNSEFNMQNAAYLRLKTIEVGYNLPKPWLTKIGVQGLRVYLSGYNLFTITGLKYCDPEFPSGNYGYNYPLNKTVTIGVNPNLRESTNRIIVFRSAGGGTCIFLAISTGQNMGSP